MTNNNFTKKALLARFSQRKFNANITDKSASKELQRDKNASSDAAKVMKKIFDDSIFDKLGHIVGLAYRYHQTMTIPWMYRGVGMLPIVNHGAYSKQMHRYKEELEIAKKELKEVLPTLIEKERNSNRLGKLWNEADYRIDDLAAHFDFEIQFFPVPDSGHFVVDVQNEAMSEIQSAFAEAEQTAIKEATKDLWARIYTVVKNMAERLDDPKGKFHDTLVGNITDLCGLLPALNIANDNQLNKMVVDIENKLTSVEPKVLREDKKIRKEVVTSAKEILSTMEAFVQ